MTEKAVKSLVKGVYENLSGNLRVLRKMNKLSQENVSQLIHMSRKHYCECENGVTIPSLITVCMLADIYKVHLDTLIAADIARDTLELIDMKYRDLG
ncbi:MAG: helix-turn-helix transcriptional regulator [Bacillota bacterium]|nr:helix-turn-helix transcriptional regulator [Bacillota bacterium]